MRPPDVRPRPRAVRGLLALLTLIPLSALAGAQAPASSPGAGPASTQPSGPRWVGPTLAIPGVVMLGRSSLGADLALPLADAAWLDALEPGQVVTLAPGHQRTVITVDLSAEQSLGGALLVLSIASDQPALVALRASGFLSAIVDGAPRTGDSYASGQQLIPLRVRAGVTRVGLIPGWREGMPALAPLPDELSLHPEDALLPTALAGQALESVGRALVLNASGRSRRVVLSAQVGDEPTQSGPVTTLAPWSSRLMAFPLVAGPVKAGVTRQAHVMLREAGEAQAVGPGLTFPLDCVAVGQVECVTFISQIDGSVQHYALRRALDPAPALGPGHALVLSLHGASVEARSQAESYAPKAWAHLVCPTNRRPFGFDWEDWGRLDGLEALAHAQATLPHDPTRVHVTGHSMGGHGTWHFGVLYPGQFASVAPSAGWISHKSYGGRGKTQPETAIGQMIERCRLPYDTLTLLENLRGRGVAILHGSGDDNVPPEQARQMATALREAGIAHEHWEVPGGHWWDDKSTDGADCVDWPGFFDLFARRATPRDVAVRSVEFLTPSPAVSSSRHWVTVDQQLAPLRMSRLRVGVGRTAGVMSGETENVARLALRLDAVRLEGTPLSLTLDGQPLSLPAPEGEGAIWLERDPGGTWAQVAAPDPATKTAQRSGPFREAYRNRMQLVYATGGTDVDRHWALAKARLDAEEFAYRGAGSVDVLADVDFDPAAEPGRNVILYGTPATHGSWKALLGEFPLTVSASRVTVGPRTVDSAGMGVMLVRPRPGSDVALVAVVAAADAVGWATLCRVPLFISSMALPDVVVVGHQPLGMPRLLLTGFFGNDWAIETGEWAAEGEPAASQPASRPATRGPGSQPATGLGR